MTKTILLSAPYMLPTVERFRPVFAKYGLELIVPEVEERMEAEQILEYAGQFDGAVCGDDRYTAEVLAACRSIRQLEEEGDALYQEWLGKLFENGADPLTVIKWKELYDILEATLDVAEDAAGVREQVTLKHA